MTVYMSICYGILYLTFEAYPLYFEFDRGWSPNLATLPFIGLFIGVLLACIILPVDSKIRYGKHLIQTKKLNPEDRIPPMIVGSLVLPAGLFWFAWASNPSTPWPAQVAAGILTGCGIILVFSKIPL
jgi:MFS transporter, DHA1 family, multidrug resistance protein